VNKLLARKTASGKLVTVTAYTTDHIDPLFDAVVESIPEVSQYETWCHPGYSRDEAVEYVEQWKKRWRECTAFYFAIKEIKSAAFLGSCGLSDLNRVHKRAGLGFWIRSSQTGQGFATDAARLVTSIGFSDLELERIELEAAVGNVASRRVAEKIGCELEGVLQHRQILPAGPTDTVMYSLIRPKWRTFCAH
jgi:RimJ/RimL family protein N-acetyltransferase